MSKNIGGPACSDTLSGGIEFTLTMPVLCLLGCIEHEVDHVVLQRQGLGQGGFGPLGESIFEGVADCHGSNKTVFGSIFTTCSQEVCSLRPFSRRAIS
jgi:hypothetical protein